MGRPASGTRDATKGLSDGAGTDEEETLGGGRSPCHHRCGECGGHAAVKSGWRDMRGGCPEGRALHGMLVLNNLIRALWMFHGLRSRHGQRAGRG